MIGGPRWALSGCSEGERTGEIQASGTVEATEADLGFQMAGRLESILVREGDSVEAGAEVAFLDREEFEPGGDRRRLRKKRPRPF